MPGAAAGFEHSVERIGGQLLLDHLDEDVPLAAIPPQFLFRLRDVLKLRGIHHDALAGGGPLRDLLMCDAIAVHRHSNSPRERELRLPAQPRAYFA